MRLTVEGGGFSYRKGRTILRDVNFSIESGEILAVLGPNGAGKTTLLRCIMGFLKWDAGRALLDGKDMREIPTRKLWRRIGYVPQAKGSFASLRAEDMILLGRTGQVGLFSTPSRRDRQIARELAEELGISHLLDQPVQTMSGGEAQMVLIARALAAEPELLILDEPESNLDFRNQLIVLDALSRLARRGIACVFNTHYPEHALSRAEKSLILKKGEGSRFGRTTDVVTEEGIRRAFGVRSVIQEVETDGNLYHTILPLALSEAEEGEDAPDRPVIGGISLLFREDALAPGINALFHEYAPFIIARMGVPVPQDGLKVIHVTMDAPAREVQALAHRLSLMPGVRVKAAMEDKAVTKDGQSNQ